MRHGIVSVKNHTKAMRFGPEFRSFMNKDIIDTTVRSLDYESETL